MLPENLDISSVNDARSKAIKKTLRPMNVDELKALEDSIFPYHDDPWRERFEEFVKENAGCSFYHATTDDPIQILYCHTKGKGIWFLPGGGVGILLEKGLKVLKEIVEKT